MAVEEKGVLTTPRSQKLLVGAQPNTSAFPVAIKRCFVCRESKCSISLTVRDHRDLGGIDADLCDACFDRLRAWFGASRSAAGGTV